MTSQHKDLTSRHHYLTSDGRNMPPYMVETHTDGIPVQLMIFLYFYISA